MSGRSAHLHHKMLRAIREKVRIKEWLNMFLRLKRRSTAVRAERRTELLYQKLAFFKPIVDAVEQAVLGLRDASDDFLNCTHKTLNSVRFVDSTNDEAAADAVYGEPVGKANADDDQEDALPEAEGHGQGRSTVSKTENDNRARSPTGPPPSFGSQMDLDLVRWELDSATMRSVIIPIARWKGSFEDLQDRMASLLRYEKEFEMRRTQVRRYDTLVENARKRYLDTEKDSDGRKLQQVAKIMRRKEIKFEASKVAFEIMEQDLFDTQQQLLGDCREFRTYLEKMVTLQREAFCAAATSLGIAPAASASPSHASGGHTDGPATDSSLDITRTPSSRASLPPLPPTSAASATRKASFRAAFEDLEKSESSSGHVIVGGRVLILHEERHREAESAASCANELPAKPDAEGSPVLSRGSPSQTSRKDGTLPRSPLSEVKGGREGTRKKQMPAADGKENVERIVDGKA
ncbi:hypothetical protein KFL_000460340 [Klebsormidium nitens]|uniref:BAR domain-containing protein n=1 Tax=Klebsormidium nitens TaxID=105231 RepID=A0A1Y1HPX2_KLENI|nr:hypothetical protein KFL_000460340 [Klebsormidium nitens]|eukprot:GAQ80123.1 hypothetical protein KFL_000460340 [Klebsormidium nitens]